MTHQFIGLL